MKKSSNHRFNLKRHRRYAACAPFNALVRDSLYIYELGMWVPVCQLSIKQEKKRFVSTVVRGSDAPFVFSSQKYSDPTTAIQSEGSKKNEGSLSHNQYTYIYSCHKAKSGSEESFSDTRYRHASPNLGALLPSLPSHNQSTLSEILCAVNVNMPSCQSPSRAYEM